MNINIQQKLDIVIVTYNRASYLDRSLSSITAKNSPLRFLDILVLDNNSNDNTKEIVKKYQKNFTNISYHKNKYNVGACANIAKAFESADKDYVWILSDDDVYDWTNWDEVEKAILADEKAIVVSRRDLPDKYKDNIGQILYQSAFNAGVIYSTKILNDTVMHNIYNNIDTMFPHLIPLVYLINNNGKFYIIDKPVVEHGYYSNSASSDASYTRGTDQNVCTRLKKNNFLYGFISAISDIKDKKIKSMAIERALDSISDLLYHSAGTKVLITQILNSYSSKDDLPFLATFYVNIDEKNVAIKFLSCCNKKDLCLALLKDFKINLRAKYFLYSVLSLVTFGRLKKKMSEKKMKYQHKIQNQEK